jgi:putative transposase
MTRSTRPPASVNFISFEELKEVLGPDFETAIRSGVVEYFARAGRAVAEALIAGEVENLCGQKHSRKRNGEAVRWGSQPGAITIRGVKEPIEKPRVRTADGKNEIDLETYTAFSKKDALREEAIVRIGSGVSTRDFGRTVRKEMRHHGISKSAVSRRVIDSTKVSMETFLARRWDKHTFVSIMIDGVHIGKTHVVAAVGIDKSGYKHVLGWQIGSTESAVVCRDLLRKLSEAGLNPDAPYLFVLDGSKALKAAVQERFGQDVLIQRCQEHKIRDVEGYLPVRLRKRFRLLLHAAYNEPNYRAASERLQKIRLQLLSVSEPSANSLTEGLEHTLTLHRLGINGGVRESLRTTNIIESAFSRLRQRTHNVSNWTDCQQVDRWMAFGLLKAEAGFRRLPGYRQLSSLQRKVQTALQSTKD